MNNDLMHPDSSPEKKYKAGVKKANMIPFFIGIAVLAIFSGIVAYVVIQKSQQKEALIKNTEYDASYNDTSRFAQSIVGNRSEGVVEAESVVDPSKPVIKDQDGNAVALTVVRPDILSETPPLPSSSTPINSRELTLNETVVDTMAQRIAEKKLEMLEKAIYADTHVEMSQQQSSVQNSAQSYLQAKNTVARHQSPESFEGKLSQVESLIQKSGLGSGAGIQKSVQNTSSSKDGYAQFDQEDRWSSNSSVDLPKLYEIRAGFVLPATMLSGINSDLPGQLIAQISQDVFDTATGHYLLIPQGSKLYGAYSNDVAYGQRRVLVAWQRIVFPDGKALDIGAMPGADSAGYTGFTDQVDNHYMRVFGSAFLMSGITAGVTLSQDDNSSEYNGNRKSSSDVLSEALGQQLGQVAIEMIRKNMNIAPTLEIRPGYRFNVIVTKDLSFEKQYESFDYKG